MANPQNPNPPTYSPAQNKPGTFIPNPDEAQDQQSQQQGADKVEIGDPVPEKDRTTRASDSTTPARGQGETGEDEDLPDNDGGVEGSRSDQH